MTHSFQPEAGAVSQASWCMPSTAKKIAAERARDCAIQEPLLKSAFRETSCPSSDDMPSSNILTREPFYEFCRCDLTLAIIMHNITAILQQYIQTLLVLQSLRGNYSTSAFRSSHRTWLGYLLLAIQSFVLWDSDLPKGYRLVYVQRMSCKTEPRGERKGNQSYLQSMVPNPHPKNTWRLNKISQPGKTPTKQRNANFSTSSVATRRRSTIPST